MKEFIGSNCLVDLKYYGVYLRLDVIFIDDVASIWVVSKRTVNKRDEVTFTFSGSDEAFSKFRSIVSDLHTSIFGNF